MSFMQRLRSWMLIAAAAALLAITLLSSALAEVDGDGDGLDGDELALPILGVGVVAVVAWIAFQRRSKKSPP
jgi:peptidoglycan/LPS O-acetylase OafA/YrhL